MAIDKAAHEAAGEMTAMSGLFSRWGSFWAWIGHIVDPLCGPVGIFYLGRPIDILACGDTGWGDEIAFGVQVTVSAGAS